MIDGVRLVMALIGLAIMSGMLIYSVRLLLATRGGILSQGWKFVAMGTIAISIGLALTAINSVTQIPVLMFYASIVVMNLGGIFFVIGLRSELSAWSLRRVKAIQN